MKKLIIAEKPSLAKNIATALKVSKVKNGYIKFHKNHTLLLAEMRRFPKTHDDGLDALEMAMGAATPADTGFVFAKLEMGGNKTNDFGFKQTNKFAI